MEKYLAPETAARMATAAAAFSGALDESQRYVLANDFELSGARREWSYLPEPERGGLAIGSLTGISAAAKEGGLVCVRTGRQQDSGGRGQRIEFDAAHDVSPSEKLDLFH